jgi:hypothetical protein
VKSSSRSQISVPEYGLSRFVLFFFILAAGGVFQFEFDSGILADGEGDDSPSFLLTQLCSYLKKKYEIIIPCGDPSFIGILCFTLYFCIQKWNDLIRPMQILKGIYLANAITALRLLF